MTKLAAFILLSTAGMYTVSAQADRIPAGTNIPVRTDSTIEAHRATNGRIYSGSVATDVLGRDGRVVIPRGTPAELIVRDVDHGDMVLDLESLTVNGHRYAVDAANSRVDAVGEKQGVGKNERTAKYVGGGALLGTIVGAIAGGGKGAAIGALSGAAAGGVGQTVTRGRDLRIPAESVVTFQLDRPIRIDVRDMGYDRDGYHYHRYDNRYDSQRSRTRDDRYNNQYR